MMFWFTEGDKFLIPTYRYYFGVGVFLWLGLASAYSISRVTRLIYRPANYSRLRLTFSAIIVATSALSVFAVANSFVTPDVVGLYLLSICLFVVIISVACWVLTAKLLYSGTFLNVSSVGLAFGFLYVVSRVVHFPGDWSQLITYPVYDSLLSASCGFWIARSQR